MKNIDEVQINGFEFDLDYFKSEIDESGQYLYIEGIASDSLLDVQADRVSKACLDSIHAQMTSKAIPIYPKHNDMDWSDEFGEIVSSKLLTARDADREVYKLWIKAKLDRREAYTKKLEDQIDRGKTLGFSIGGKLLQSIKEPKVFVKADGTSVVYEIRTVNDVKLDHVCVTRKPVNPRTWITNIIKSLGDTEIPEEVLLYIQQENNAINKSNSLSKENSMEDQKIEGAVEQEAVADQTSIEINKSEEVEAIADTKVAAAEDVNKSEVVDAPVNEVENIVAENTNAVEDVAKPQVVDGDTITIESLYRDLQAVNKLNAEMLDMIKSLSAKAPEVTEDKSAVVENTEIAKSDSDDVAIPPEEIIAEANIEKSEVVQGTNLEVQSSDEFLMAGEIENIIKESVAKSMQSFSNDLDIAESVGDFATIVNNLLKSAKDDFIGDKDESNYYAVNIYELMPEYVITKSIKRNNDFDVVEKAYVKVPLYRDSNNFLALDLANKTAVKKMWVDTDVIAIVDTTEMNEADDVGKSQQYNEADSIEGLKTDLEKANIEKSTKSLEGLDIDVSPFDSNTEEDINKSQETNNREFKDANEYLNFLILNPSKNIKKYDDLFEKSIR